MMVSGPGFGTNYPSWANCGIGSSVTTQSRQDMEGGITLTATCMTTLRSVHPERVRVEVRMTMQFEGAPRPMPAQESRHVMDISAKVEPTPDFEQTEVQPDGGEVSLSRQSWPLPADDPTYREGDDTLEIAGQQVRCRWNERVVRLRERRVRFRTWFSDQIPGGLARTEARVEGHPSEDNDLVVTAFEKK